MLSASYFSLLGPAIDLAGEGWYGPTWSFVPACVGFLLGGGFVYAGDKFGPGAVMGPRAGRAPMCVRA